jgi:ABC-2 type transport system permease protein
VGNEPIAASVVNPIANEYLGTVRSHLLADITTKMQISVPSQLDWQQILKQASADMSQSAEVNVLKMSESAVVSPQWVMYMRFCSYVILISVIVCAGIMLMAFNRNEIRRRDLSAPISTLSMNMQLALATIIVGVIAWTWVCILGLIVFGSSLGGVSPTIIALVYASFFLICLVGLAIAFLITQLTSSEIILNAAGNIGAMVISFISGIWVPIEFLGEGFKTVAHFMPTFYFNDTLTRAFELHDTSLESLVSIFSNIGIIALFAVAIFAIALALGRLRQQTSEAGGNSAAHVATS